MPFLNAIRERPDDDLPRLVFADWLEEHGDQPERAELIRVQCELWRRDPGRQSRAGLLDPANPNFGTPEIARENALLSSVGFSSLTGIPRDRLTITDPSGRPRVCRLPDDRFVRGFIEGLSASWQVIELLMDAFYAAQPTRAVSLTTLPPFARQAWGFGGAELFSLPPIRRRRGVRLTVGGAEIRELQAMGTLEPRIAERLLVKLWPGVLFDFASAENPGTGRRQPGEAIRLPAQEPRPVS